MRLLLFSLLMLIQNVGLPSPASVEGMVVHADTGEPVSGIEVSLGHPLRLVPGSGLLGAAGRARRPTFKPIEPVLTDANGRFSFNDVEPGTIGLTTASNRFVHVSAMFLGGNGGPQWMEFDLAPGENRRNLVVRLSEVAVITGTVLRASGRSGVATPVQVWRANFEYRDSERNFQLAYSATADDRGRYRIPGVIPGRYYVTAGNVPGQSEAASDVEFAYFRFVRVPEGYYVASAKLDGVEYLGRPVPLTGPTADRLEVTLSPTGGLISGTVTAGGSRAVANVQVALVPNRRDQWHVYRHVFTDAEGRFAFTDTAPGDYKLFAWETPVRNGYVDPVLLKEFEEQGKPIHVDEGRAAIATVPLTSLR